MKTKLWVILFTVGLCAQPVFAARGMQRSPVVPESPRRITVHDYWAERAALNMLAYTMTVRTNPVAAQGYLLGMWMAQMYGMIFAPEGNTIIDYPQG